MDKRKPSKWTWFGILLIGVGGLWMRSSHDDVNEDLAPGQVGVEVCTTSPVRLKTMGRMAEQIDLTVQAGMEEAPTVHTLKSTYGDTRLCTAIKINRGAAAYTLLDFSLKDKLELGEVGLKLRVWFPTKQQWGGYQSLLSADDAGSWMLVMTDQKEVTGLPYYINQVRIE